MKMSCTCTGTPGRHVVYGHVVYDNEWMGYISGLCENMT